MRIYRLDTSLKTFMEDGSNLDSDMKDQSFDFVYHQSTIVITPDLEIFASEFIGALRECMNFGSYTETLSSRQEVNRLLTPVIGEISAELSLDDLVIRNVKGSEQILTSVDTLRDDCYNMLHACIRQCTELLTHWDHLRENHDKNYMYRTQLEHASVITKQPLELDDDLIRLNEELKEVESMLGSNELGVVRFEVGKILKKYKSELIDCLGRCTSLSVIVIPLLYLVCYVYVCLHATGLLHKRIVATYRGKCEGLTDTLFTLKYSISTRSKQRQQVVQLEEYVSLMGKYKLAIAQQESLEESYKFVVG